MIKSLFVREYPIASHTFISLSGYGYSENIIKSIFPLKTDLISLPITNITDVYIVIIENPNNADEYLSLSI